MMLLRWLHTSLYIHIDNLYINSNRAYKTKVTIYSYNDFSCRTMDIAK